ncbi:TonB-dependent receptor [Algoriphagus sp. D3-2-R+10]|uniref:TonB-dependent receptor domain-containing protein n=1 Tax=Algoriphagus aurantiacus TaxID=3103948 RepID=UPI002B390A25|nr:TonB-dependent receptor [Algoriphagus sp. D3-2-R+10]MEB2778201.1 TonB-dependent receptor [Algoriphagus sp. D3-2-R+10]
MKPQHKFLLILALIASPLFGLAQTFELTGTLRDQERNEALGFVQVALFESERSASPIIYSDTDEQGQFVLQAEQGDYVLKAFFIGYEDLLVKGVKVNGDVSLGELTMVSDAAKLEEVVVQTTKMPVRSSLEGIIISPENNLANAGGTLLDILRNTPSISVSEDGSISLRGSSGTNILINGRNSSLTQNLDQLPASAVEEIKIINNPNARYDAAAEGGVIDIVLKKGQDFGTHGGVEATYGTRARTSMGGRINHRNVKFNVFGGYNYRNWKSIGERSSIRVIFEDQEKLDQNTISSEREPSHNLNYGADYYFGNNVLSYEGVYQYGHQFQTNTLFSELSSLASGDSEESFDYVRRNNEDEIDEGLDNALIFEHNFKDKGHLFRATASYSYRNQYKTQNIDIFTNTLNPSPENLTGEEQAFTDEVRNITVLQADYIQPWETGKFEAGLKSNIRKFDNDYRYLRYRETSDSFVEDPAVSNQFLYKDQIHAGYAIFSSKKEKFEYALGLRGEYTQVDTYLKNTDETNNQRYFNLFPSVQGMYNLNENHSLKVTYSRRIDRPTAWRLNPFPDITDSLNIRRGNPDLEPEMINSFELGHLANFEKSSFTTNLFYRQVNGQLDFITIVEDGISYSQPSNLLSSQSYGMEFIGVSEVNSWYSVNGGLTLFRITVDGSNISEDFTNSGFSWNAKLTQDFKLPLGVNLQLVGNYDSPEVEAQGRDLARYSVDASVQKSFIDDKASILLSLRDVFNTQRFAGQTLTNTFSQEFRAKRETRIFLVTARYNF